MLIGKVSVQIYLFLNWVVCLKSSLHILGTSPLSDTCFAKMFFPSGTCLFTLLTVSFIKHKFLVLMNSNLPTSSFMNYTFGGVVCLF